MNDIFYLENENGITPFLNTCKYDYLLPELINTIDKNRYRDSNLNLHNVNTHLKYDHHGHCENNYFHGHRGHRGHHVGYGGYDGSDYNGNTQLVHIYRNDRNDRDDRDNNGRNGRE